MKLHFRTKLKECPYCGSTLVPYTTRHRTVISSYYGEFIAIEHIMKCDTHGIFRSEELQNIVSPYCTYANDIMIDSAMKRFIDGKSCSEISMESGTGISESQVRKLSNMALGILVKIHEEATPKLKESMHSYILQIDGTTDSEFSMIVAVRDAVSGFTLYARKCSSESNESIRNILQSVKKKFGTPSGITCDMRAGIISAAMEVFPEIPIRICLMHFLRGLGKDIMEDLHTDLGKKINLIGIKSTLNAILRSMPDYDQRSLYEVENGFCSDRERMETMSVRRILENLVRTTGSSGYGFPFSLKHLSFFIACSEAEKKLEYLSNRITGNDSAAFISAIMKETSKVTGNASVKETAGKLSDINSLIFQNIRKAFMIPDKGSLSEEMPDDSLIHERCNVVIGEMEVYLHTNISSHLFTAAKKAIERYREREDLLFANNAEHTIPRTNNGMERFFRKVRRNVRKRCGNISTGNILTQSGESLTLFQNLSNPEYLNTVFGSEDISAFFARYRKPFKKNGMTKKRMIELIDRGTKMILDGSLYDSPYSESMLEVAYSSRNITKSEKYRSV